MHLDTYVPIHPCRMYPYTCAHAPIYQSRVAMHLSCIPMDLRVYHMYPCTNEIMMCTCMKPARMSRGMMPASTTDRRGEPNTNAMKNADDTVITF